MEDLIQPLDIYPLWLIFIFTVIILFLAPEIGFRLGKVIQERWPDKFESSLGAMVGAALALLGLLLAFVTSIAIGIYNERRQLVISEANAIDTSFAYTAVLDDLEKDTAQQLLREYVTLRLSVSDLRATTSTTVRSEQILDELWSKAVVIARADPNPVIAHYLSALRVISDQNTARLNAEFSNRIPPTIILGLYAVAILTMMLDGVYNSFGQRRNLLGLVIVVLILSVVFILIIDLDRTQQGLIKISQKALLDLQTRLNAMP